MRLAASGLFLKGDAAMTQEFIVLLLVGLVGVIWVIVLDIRGDKQHRHDKRVGNPSPEPHDWRGATRTLIPAVECRGLTKERNVYIILPINRHATESTIINHLVLNGMHHPLLPSPPSQNQRVTVSLPKPLIERLRNAVYWTEVLPMASLVAEAIKDIVTQMEEANGGAFPQRVSPLKRGRRQGNRSPVHSTPRGTGREVLSAEF